MFFLIKPHGKWVYKYTYAWKKGGKATWISHKHFYIHPYYIFLQIIGHAAKFRGKQIEETIHVLPCIYIITHTYIYIDILYIYIHITYTYILYIHMCTYIHIHKYTHIDIQIYRYNYIPASHIRWSFNPKSSTVFHGWSSNGGFSAGSYHSTSRDWTLQDLNELYPLVNIQKAIENHHLQ